jgi:hypothetical protein
MIKGIQLQQELIKAKGKEELLLEEVAQMLENSVLKEEDILKRLSETNSNLLTFNELSQEDKNMVFSLEEVKVVCVKYRLRFLDSKHFQSEFPYEAISKIKELEKRYNTTFQNFKIIAPDKVFHLQDINQDPLLFAQLSNNKFLLIHQWGKDLAWYRALKYYPVRNIYSYFNSIIALAVIVALAIPFDWMNVDKEFELGLRFWLSIHFFIALFFFVLFLGSIGKKTFSEDNWNSKYFNE